MGRRSVATIDSPEFLNITSVSPKISKCEVKVMYVGQNRNRSCITKEVATEMAKTLPGVPIVGYWSETKEDFLDHGERIVIDGEGVKFQDMTRPYGFIAPDAKIWFQKFEDTDDFGNTVVREYLMTEGYLWTEQYEECKRIMDKGNPQSMKLDKNLSGFWSTGNNKGIDFFIINDAMFENLCILGEDVEPCFEGSDITAPKLSSNFSLNDNMVRTLFSMMEELKEVVTKYNEGGSLNMDKNTEAAVVETNAGVEFEQNENALATPEAETTVVEESSSNGDTTSESFAKKEEEKEDSQNKEEENKEDKGSDDNNSPVPPKKDDEEDEEDQKKKYELLENEFAALQTKYNELESQFNSLVEFKKEIENEKKDALINSFYMLSDEDKADVITNKENYSLDDIEAKLSVICVRKKVNFDLDTNNENDNTIEANMTTFNLNSTEGETAPEWVTAMRNVKNNSL